MTPEADSLVAPWRLEHDWASLYGVTAHVTVRSPFLDPDEWPNAELATLDSLLPVSLTLAQLEDRPGALVILVDPDEQLREVTTAIGNVWPELPPHKDEFERPRYHVTVARTQDPEVRRMASDAIAPHLPVEVNGTALWATAGSPEAGLVHRVIAAGG
jgi:2'-5' RNA ligase superfamily